MNKHKDLKNINYLLLDSISDDYYNVWEPYSEIKQYYNGTKENFKDIFLRTLQKLYDLELISFYEGISFNGEEKPIELNIDENLLNELLQDWKDSSNTQIRITTSEKADDYLKLKYMLEN